MTGLHQAAKFHLPEWGLEMLQVRGGDDVLKLAVVPGAALAQLGVIGSDRG